MPGTDSSRKHIAQITESKIQTVSFLITRRTAPCGSGFGGTIRLPFTSVDLIDGRQEQGTNFERGQCGAYPSYSPETNQRNVVVVESPSSEKDEAIWASIAERVPSLHPPTSIESENAHHRPPTVSVDEALAQRSSGRESQHIVYTERCEYALEGEEGHGVISGIRRVFTRCEDEQIHIPGAIQSHGMLVAIERREEPDLNYVPRIVSENSHSVCQYSPRDIFALDSFLRIFPAHQRPLFHSQARAVWSKFVTSSQSSEPKVFSVAFMDPGGYLIPCWCAMHVSPGPRSLLICEFEHQEHPRMDPSVTPENLPSTLFNTLDSDPLDAASSLQSRSLPLSSSLPIADLFAGDGRTMEVLNIMCQIQKQLSAAREVQYLLNIIVGVIHELTTFHRCMVYKFDESFNGTVVAELINPQASRDFYKGLHFPSTDIPKQARNLYKINKVRVLFDRAQEPARLVCRSVGDLNTPLDLTHSYLRAMSPVHLKYLGNMGVRSTMSVSLDYRHELWGLICCHSYGPTGTKIPFPVRELCYWVGLCASNCLDKLLNATKLDSRKVINSLRISANPHIYITASSEELLHLFQADFGFLVVREEARTIGKLSSYLEAVTLLRYVYFRKFENIFASQNISQDFTDLNYEPEFQVIAGLLFIPLSPIAGDFVLLFRHNQIKEVHWAGNPNLKSAGVLEPRDNFKKWTEKVHGTCREWTEEQFEAAAMARLVYGNFSRVWREKETALNETRMKRLLLLNLSHEVRTPLNAIVNYLEMALEKPLENSTKQILSMSHSASKSLIYVIDDLLHLTGNRAEPSSLLTEPFDIQIGLQETINNLKQHALQKSLTFDVAQDPDFPQYVQGDLERLQKAVSSLVLNALQNTSKGGITVRLKHTPQGEKGCVVNISVKDTGNGMSESDLDDLFQEFEQVPGEEVQSHQTPMAAENANPGQEERHGRLGLGLALVARFIKNCNGQIRVTSKEGQGTTFTLDVPYELCSESSHPLQSIGSPREDHSECQQPDAVRVNSSLPPPETAFRWNAVAGTDVSVKKTNMERSASVGYPSADPIPTLSRDTESSKLDDSLEVLVADDNNVNLSILQRRLEQMGHEVRTSRDGQECFDIFKEHHERIDFILMDLNMPFVDGIRATTMIRAAEGRRSLCQTQSQDQSADQSQIRPPPLSRAAQICGRTPIFAVSASLKIEAQSGLMEAGFDGWLVKPINFRRLNVVLAGALSRDKRKEGIYHEKEFRLGGWFS
ncbi:hypothetical protein K432DRAFT_445052 [Lepidopterella palustris CBS 459.81]|uniref:Phytochrome n=1 Tax=Lepidopterella palustris CBS 459.81 TaxID=1314670 RepID=A0A8E2E621_9PEZI|nr:hypothetical protein K432DRAFT_445052 [Lepidopterella palustris CBS 459.81]